MFLVSSRLLAFLTLSIIIAVTDADTNKKCNARWRAYGFNEDLNNLRRDKVQEVIRRKQGVVEYTCEHERVAAQIRDKIVEEDPTFTYAIDLAFAAKKELKVHDEVTVFPEGMLEYKLLEIDVGASSFGCARSDGIEQPPPKTTPKITTPKKKKNKKKKKPAKKPKKNKNRGKLSNKSKKQKGSGKAKMPAKAVKGKGIVKKGKPKPKHKVKKGKNSGKRKNKKLVPKPNVNPPPSEPIPLKIVYFVCVYKLNTFVRSTLTQHNSE